MQTSIQRLAIATAACASLAHAGVSFDANIEHDITKVSNTDLSSGGRIELNAKAELAKSADYFINAKGTVTIPTGSGSSVGIDDAWVNFGNSKVDLKIGRFEAIDAGGLGKDTVVERLVTGYNGNALRGRVTTGALHAALGMNLSSAVRAELGLVSRKDSNNYGLRPAISASLGAVSVRAAVESIRQEGAASQTGYGFNVGYDLGSGAAVGFSHGKNNTTDASTTALFTTINAFGVGYVRDTDSARVSSNTLYAAYTLGLLGLKGASVTPAFSSSRSAGTNKTAVKVRFNYAF